MKWVKPSPVNGVLDAPASKSMTLRAIAAATLSKGESCIEHPSYCDDALAGLNIAKALGACLEREKQLTKITGGGPLRKTILNCNESGLCMRMFTPIAALYHEEITVTGTGSLTTRPMGIMEKPLHHLGVYCKTNDGFAPLLVRGPIKAGKVRIDGSISSQFLTGLLLALPLCKENSELLVDNLKSKPYVAMTLNLLKLFGISIIPEKDFERFIIKGNQSYKSTTYHVEGDWSGASFLLVAGAVGGKVSIRNLQASSFQADKRILEALELAGARVYSINDSVSVERNELKAFEMDATECPDLIPPLAALACCCIGRSQIYGIERLKHKESDRAQTLLAEFTKIGGEIKINGNKMEIEGRNLEGGILDSHNDHRIAMAGAIAGLNSKNGVKIEGWKCVSKSYPGFFEDLESIGGDIE